MPLKKTTTKKTPAKKTVVKKKTTVKKVVATKKPTVIVKENPIKKNKTGCMFKDKGMHWVIIAILLVINTVLLIVLSANTNSFQKTLENFETEKVGGASNYELIQEIYKMDIYKVDQQRRLETALQQLKGLEDNGQMLPPSAGNDLPLVLPTE